MTSAIVIGGGIAGCSTAYALAKRGIAVTLIERHRTLALEASGNPIAVLYPKFSTKFDFTTTLALQGFQFTLDLLKQLPASNAFFNDCGLIQLAFGAREQARQQAILHNERLITLQHLDPKLAGDRAGITLTIGGLYLPQAGWVQPVVLCKALCSHALINVTTLSNALKIEKRANEWQVFDSKSNGFRADIVVICNANDIKQFKQCDSVKITSIRGQINFFAQNEVSKNVKSIICSNHFLSPALDGAHSIGTTYAPNDLNPNISAADTRENMHALRKISPEIYENLDMNSIQTRVAWRSQTPDYMPLAGQLLDDNDLRKNPPRYNAKPADLPWLQGLYVNAGHGSKGMITAPICGELIASLICKNALPTDDKLASRMSPSRFLLRELGLKQLANSIFD